MTMNALPKPYYQDDAVTLYLGDCREIVPLLGRFDLLLTDPPFGVNCEVSTNGDRITGDEDTAVRDCILAMFPTTPAIVFGSPKIARPKNFGTVLIWDKGELTGMGNLAFPWKPTHEEIYVIGAGFSGSRRGGSVLRYVSRPAWTNHPQALCGVHPNEKPLALITHLLENSPAGSVIDPFAGSGSTLRACKDLGRKCVGIEIEEKYAEICARRMAQEVLPL